MSRKHKKKNKNTRDYQVLGQQNYRSWFIHYFGMLKEIAFTRFQWTNIPSEIDERAIESILMSEGRLVFFKDKNLGYAFAPVAQGGQIDVYYNPIQNFAITPTGIPNSSKREFTNHEDSVVIYNNFSRVPILEDLRLYAMDLAEITASIKINTYNQRLSKIIGATDETIFNVRKIQNGIDDYASVIFAKSEMMDNMKTFDLSTPYVADKLQIIKEKKWNEVMAFLGINNNNVSKAERVQSAEVHANNEQIQLHMLSFLKAREQGVREINELFGLNIGVKPRELQWNIDNPAYVDDKNNGGIDTGG